MNRRSFLKTNLLSAIGLRRRRSRARLQSRPENSPALQRWVTVPQDDKSHQGRQNVSFVLPDSIVFTIDDPALKRWAIFKGPTHLLTSRQGPGITKESQSSIDSSKSKPCFRNIVSNSSRKVRRRWCSA